jgi:hypothetical protein
MRDRRPCHTLAKGKPVALLVGLENQGKAD